MSAHPSWCTVPPPHRVVLSAARPLYRIVVLLNCERTLLKPATHDTDGARARQVRKTPAYTLCKNTATAGCSHGRMGAADTQRYPVGERSE